MSVVRSAVVRPAVTRSVAVVTACGGLMVSAARNVVPATGNVCVRRRIIALSFSAVFLWMFVLVATCLIPETGRAQTPPPGPAAPPASSAPDSAFRPGLIDAIGNLIDRSKGDVSDRLNDAQQSINRLNNAAGDVTRDAAESLTSLPGTRMVTGRVVCAPAANGAPDCKAAADALCKSKGLGAGRSVDSETAENCPVQVLLSGKPPKPGECRMDTYVTRAVCQ